MKNMFSNLYDTGERNKDALEVKMTALKKKSKATKCSDPSTISLIAHAVKIVVRVVRIMIQIKIEGVLGEDQFGFRSNAIGTLRTVRERTQNIDYTSCACFIDWQKAFCRVKWTKLMQILKEIATDCRAKQIYQQIAWIRVLK